MEPVDRMRVVHEQSYESGSFCFRRSAELAGERKFENFVTQVVFDHRWIRKLRIASREAARHFLKSKCVENHLRLPSWYESRNILAAAPNCAASRRDCHQYDCECRRLGYGLLIGRGD